jgi:hypothetical protein
VGAWPFMSSVCPKVPGFGATDNPMGGLGGRLFPTVRPQSIRTG